MSTTSPERIARLMALAVARGRIADLSAAEQSLVALRHAAKHTTSADTSRLRTVADRIWSVLAAGTVDVLDGPAADDADLVAALRSAATPELLQNVQLGRLGAAKRLWQAAGIDTSGWSVWPDVEPGHPPRSAADLDLPGLVGMPVEVDVDGHPEKGYTGRLLAARDDVLVLAWNRPEYGGVTLVPTGRVLAVRVLDELLPWAMLDELEELDL